MHGGRGMRRVTPQASRTRAWLAAAVVLVSAATVVAAPGVASDDLALEILRRIPEWPGTQVEIPIGVYEEFVRFQQKGPQPPQPPEVAWIERAVYRLELRQYGATIAAAFDVAGLPGEGARSVRLVPATHAWKITCRSDRPHTLRRGDDGWFYLDMMEAAPYRVEATTSLSPEKDGDVRRMEFATAPAAWTTCEVTSDDAWEVRFSRSPLVVIGDKGGTRGTIGLAAGDRLAVTWQKPRPEVEHAARIETEAHVGWTLAEGVHQVRAVLNLRLWGGAVEQLDVALPAGADRVEIIGPDVREVRLEGPGARVFLRGPVRQRTHLTVAFEVPRPPSGRMTLPAPAVVGARPRGGTLAIAGGGGGVLLEMESPGLEPLALYDLPDATRALLSAPPVCAYALSGAWEARVDLVGTDEFPVRETLIDSALLTVLYRPDGQVMTKALYQVRNRARQYMTVALPAGSRLVVVRVSEEQTNPIRGPGSAIRVPLEKSVLTTAGLVSFPVEIVTMMRAEPLERKGRFRLPLPRTDLPVAYARCALMLPEGMHARSWSGPLRPTEAWSSETAELEFEYGRGHLAKPPRTPPPEPAAEPEPPVEKPPEAKPPKGPGLLEALAGLFRKDAPKYNAVIVRGGGPEPKRPQSRTGPQTEEEAELAPTPPPTRQPTAPEATTATPSPTAPAPLAPPEAPEPLDEQHTALLAKNLYRAGVSFYQRNDYEKARGLFQQTVEAAPNSVEAGNARMFLGNIDVAQGKGEAKSAGERGQKAAAKAVQLTQQEANVDLRQRQKDLLAQAREAQRRGDEQQAEAAYRVAVDLSTELQQRGEEAREQTARVREAEEFLAQRQSHRESVAQEIESLKGTITELKDAYAKVAGKETADALSAVILSDAPGLGNLYSPQSGEQTGTLGVAAEDASQPAPQVQLGKALAEQQVTLGGRDRGRSGAPDFGGQAPAYDVSGDNLDAQTRARDALQQQFNELVSSYKKLAGRKWQTGAREEPPGDKPRDIDADGFSELTLTPELKERVADRAKALQDEARRVTTLAREGRLAEAEQLAERLEKQAQVTAGAARVLTGKQYVLDTPEEPPAGQVVIADGDTLTLGEAVRDARVLERQRITHDYLGDAHVEGGTVTRDDVQTALDEVARLRRELRTQARSLDEVKFNLNNVAGDADGRRLAEFVASNYSWALNAPGQATQDALRRDGYTPIAPGADRLTGWIGGGGATGANITGLGGPSAVPFAFEAGTNSLVVTNDDVSVETVREVLGRLQRNLGQRVGVASRNFFVDAGTARAAGIRWQSGENNTRYAVVNEGQLLAMMDIEQRTPSAAATALVRDARQETIVGTDAMLANGVPVTISRAADETNTLTYNGNAVAVTHDDYLLVDNGTYLTAVKSGRMQHWSAEAEPLRFPGVPAAVVVPAVGRTLKFEKTLLDPSDAPNLEAEYTWEGETR